MKILHVITRYQSGGSERNLLSMMRWEQRQGHDVHLAVGRDSDTEALPGDIPAQQISTLVRSVRPLQDLRAIYELRGIVRRECFDVVHTHQSKAGFIGRRAARGIAPAIVHTIHMASFGPGYSRSASLVFALAERYCAGFTDVIVSVGDELRDRYLKAGIGTPEQYFVLHSPIDVDSFSAVRTVTAIERRTQRERLGFNAEGKLVVSVGALEPRKRHDLIIRRLAPLLRRCDLTLALAGDGAGRAEVEATVRELQLDGRVRLLGHVSDVPALLSCADAYVHAATVEGVPQTVLQAVTAGLPVVATDTVGLREIEGAPVTITPSDGTRLAESVEAVLASVPAPVDIEALMPWHPDCIEKQTARFYARIESVVAAATR